MHKRKQPESAPNSPGVESDDIPQIETPVIQSQDLEHRPNADTRVNSKGVKIKPSTEPLPDHEIDALEKEDEKAREAIGELEEQYRKLPPG